MKETEKAKQISVKLKHGERAKQTFQEIQSKDAVAWAEDNEQELFQRKEPMGNQAKFRAR